jgi:hypothetical protein
MLLFVACGGDDGGSTTTAAPATTAAPETTEPATTEWPVFTTDELVAALPTLDDLGEGWLDLGGEPTADPAPNEGLGIGTCGGPNAAGRAAQSGVLAVVQGPNVQGPDERLVGTSIYVFPDDVAASEYLASTETATQCPDGVEWERIQRSNPTMPEELNGFSIDGFADGETWFVTEYAESVFGDPATDGDPADEVLYIQTRRDRNLTAFDVTFAESETTLIRTARWGNVVVVTWVNGRWGYEGYVNLEELVAFEPEIEDLADYSSIAEPVVLARLGLI